MDRLQEIRERERLAYIDDKKKRETAHVIVGELAKHLDFESVLDLGCGTMVYREEFEKHGDYLGVDGNPDASPMKLHDLREPFELKADLVFLIEVAEHIESEYESVFLDTVVNNARKWVVMTACPPKGGKSEYRSKAHFNEQLREYWIKKLEDRGLTYEDELSQKIQAEYKKHPVKNWFKYNLMVFSCADS